MDITNFLGDVETIADLHNIKEPKHGDSVYVISGGHLYLAVQTKIGIDWKQLRDGRGSRGLTGKTGASGQQGEKGDRGLKGDKGDKGDRGNDGLNGRDGVDGKDGTDGRDGRDAFAVCKDGEPGKDGKDGEDGKGWDEVRYDPTDGRFHFTSQSHPQLNYTSPPLYIPFRSLSLQEIADKLRPYL